MKWVGEFNKPILEYQIPTLFTIKFNKKILGVKRITISGVIRLDPWQDSWEKSLSWSIGFKTGGGVEPKP